MSEDNDPCMFDELEPLELYESEEELLEIQIGISDAIKLEEK